MENLFTKEKLYQLFEEKGIAYEAMEHEPVFTMEDLVRLGVTEKGTVCKNLFLRDAKGKNHFLVTVPDEKKVDLRELGDKLGTKLSFASAERLEKHLGVDSGCVSPLSVLNDEKNAVLVIFDKDLQNNPQVGIHPNDNTASIWLAFKDLKKLIEDHGNDIELYEFPIA